MSTIHNRDRKAALALALASGGTVKRWADEHRVPERTAFTWSNSPEVRDQVAAIRRQLLDRAIGRLADNAVRAADEIARLVEEGSSDAVKLQAARAVLADLMAVSDYVALEGRLADVERRLADAQAQ